MIWAGIWAVAGLRRDLRLGRQPNAGYPNGTVFKTQPLDKAPQGSEVTAFVSTGPPAGVRGINQCLLIIRSLPPDIFKYLVKPTPTP